jgi:hypothetical protein
VAGGWRSLHNEELHTLYASPNIIHVIKSRRILLAGHIARIVEITNKRIRLQDLKGRDHSEDKGVDGRIILKLMFEEKDRQLWTGFIWLRIRSWRIY